MERIRGRLAELKARSERALCFSLTAGYPLLHSANAIIPVLEEGGADLIEIGIPFLHTFVDDAEIRESRRVALRNGITIPLLFREMEQLRRETSIPLLVTAHVNSILHYGMDAFFRDAANAGLDGMFFPELPIEESGLFGNQLTLNNLVSVEAIASSTSADRANRIDERATGYLHMHVMDATEGRNNGGGNSFAQLSSVFTSLKNPLFACGEFGSLNAVRSAGRSCDGVVVSGPLLKRIARGHSGSRFLEWVSEYKNVLR